MKIKVPLKKLMQNQIRPSLKKVMEKWRNPKDIYAFVRIAEALDKAQKDYGDVVRITTESFGVPVGDIKSVDVEVITNYLLSKHGKVGKDGRWTLEGCEPGDVAEFVKAKATAEKILTDYNKEMDKILEEVTEIEILRLVKLAEKDVKSEVINANDIYLLLPFFDLENVGGDEEPKPASTEGDEDEEE